MENRGGLFVIIGSIVFAALFLIPTFLPSVFGPGGSMEGKWFSKPISLGLDLSGGVHLVYQVDTDEALAGRLQSLANSIRSDLLKEKIAIVRGKSTENGLVEFIFLTEQMAQRGREMIEKNNRELLFKETAPDGSRFKLIYSVSEPTKVSIRTNAVNQAVETLRNRVDQFGVTEPLIQRVGEDRIMLQMPGVSDVAAVKRIVGKVAKLEFRLVALPRSDIPTISLPVKDGGTATLEDEVKMGGDAVERAAVSMDAQRGVTVDLSLTSEGSKTFGKVTSENVGRQLAIVLDGKVYSNPVIESAIIGGQAVITGGFSPDEARELAVVLRSGALPATLNVMEERTVGPTLGRESIKAGVVATLVGLAMIGIFMSFYYKKAGLVAVFTLTLNAFLILASLSAFGATLTLPGIAGLALTLGIAVDSNVIIFERIKDELANGAGRDAAVVAGFDKAYSALLDANLTGLISAVVLYIFGTGPIRGFAVTLSIGTLTTLFCAIFVAKVIFDLLPLRGKGGLSI